MVNMKYCKVQIHELSWFNQEFIIHSQFLTIPKKAKIRSINVSRKWKHWHIKTESKPSIILLYCEFFFILSAYPFVNYLMFLRNIQSWTQSSSVYIRYFDRSLLVRTSKRPLIDSITSRRTTSDWPKLFGLTEII